MGDSDRGCDFIETVVGRHGVCATIRISLLASVCGGIGLAAMLASRAPLFEHSQSTELFFALIFSFPINLLLAPLVYLVIRRKKTIRA